MAAVRSRAKKKEKCINGRGGDLKEKLEGVRIEADQSGKINLFFWGGGRGRGFGTNKG